MRRVWMWGLLLWVFVACGEKAPPEGAVRLSVLYGSYRPACVRVVARDPRGQEGQTDIPRSQFKDLDARLLRVAVFRKAEWGRTLALEVSSFEGSTEGACSGAVVETVSTPSPLEVSPGQYATYEATLRAKDDDGDGFIAREEGVVGLDCDDGKRDVHPGASERCSVSVDYDCDGFKGCRDSKCQQQACDDDNACTKNDRCEGTGALAQCKGQAVVCQKPAGACVTGATCSQATGECVPVRKPCTAPPTACVESAGSCVEATGQCEYPPKQASVACDDIQACTTGDVCDGAGSCRGTSSPACTPSTPCFRPQGTCQATGCTESPDTGKVNTACQLANGTGAGVCRVTDGACSRFPYKPSNFDPDAIDPASLGVLKTTCDVIFDTTALSWSPENCVTNPPPATRQAQAQGPGLVLFALSSLDLGGEVQFVGDRAVLLAVYGDATLNYSLLANGDHTTPGAGGNHTPSCTDRQGKGGSFANSAGGGGGGASGGTAGALGNSGSTAGSTGGGVGAEGGAGPSPLFGGCPGGSGGGDATLAGAGGGGGGAVQVSVAGILTVTQLVSASAGGGIGGQSISANGGQVGGGGGGGSGGRVLLEAYELNLSSTSRLTANGGGAGQGGSHQPGSQLNGATGANGARSSATPANGGAENPSWGGRGGAGGALNKTPVAGAPGTSASNSVGGGGGGGGAVGSILLRAVKPCAIDAASVSSPAATRQCPL